MTSRELGESADNGFAAQGRLGVERRLRGDKEGITHRDELSEKEVEFGADACTHSTEQESCLTSEYLLRSIADRVKVLRRVRDGQGKGETQKETRR